MLFCTTCLAVHPSHAQNILKADAKIIKRLKIKSIFYSFKKRLKHSRRYKVRLMYQDEARPVLLY